MKLKYRAESGMKCSGLVLDMLHERILHHSLVLSLKMWLFLFGCGYTHHAWLMILILTTVSKPVYTYFVPTFFACIACVWHLASGLGMRGVGRTVAIIR